MDDTTCTRSVAFQLRADPEGDGRTLEGYAAVFNSPTLIRDALGEYEEQIAPGAFKKTLRERTPVLMFEHGKHPLIGSMPIGTIDELREDDRGLFLRARLFDNWMIDPLRDAITDQAVDGMSFRFSVPKNREAWGKRADGTPTRLIREASLFELGPVVFPAYTDTSVALRSLEQIVPDVFRRDEQPPAETPGTSDDAADEVRTSDDAATPDAPAPQVDHPSTPQLSRSQKARLIRFDRRDK